MATVPVSICVTTYNRARVLPATIDSLLEQTFGDFELIISDDGSSDDTQPVCRDYERRDPRVRYFRNEKNLNMPGNLNKAIERAAGAYLANLHDGDVYQPRLIQDWKRALDRNPHAPFVFNAYKSLNKSGGWRIYREPFEDAVPGNHIALHFFRTATSCVFGTVMARAQAYRRAGKFNPEFGFISDVDMWLTLACGNEAAYVPEPLITTTPREGHKPHYGWPWRNMFWTLGIYRKARRIYAPYMDAEMRRSARRFPQVIRNWAVVSMLGQVRHRHWAEVSEGLRVWRDAPDPVLRTFGRTLGRASESPNWYRPQLWQGLVAG